MVFTGDHFNSPSGMQKLEESGVLSKARADDLRNLALQECDLILHEAGAPPIHTPLSVLLELPEQVKKRLYVVHTSSLPDNCELKVAPTGTKGTIRLDQLNHTSLKRENVSVSGEDEYEGTFPSRLPEYETTNLNRTCQSSFTNLDNVHKGRYSVIHRGTSGSNAVPPLVALRPASSTDAWFILNLLSAVPFVSRYVL